VTPDVTDDHIVELKKPLTKPLVLNPLKLNDDRKSSEIAQSSSSTLELRQPMRPPPSLPILVDDSTTCKSETLAQLQMERKLPPLFYHMKAIWREKFTSHPSEAEWAGLPTVGHNVRSVFGIDIYEARVRKNQYQFGMMSTAFVWSRFMSIVSIDIGHRKNIQS
jgi:hypothetical protein